jgi:hypothetical protein
MKERAIAAAILGSTVVLVAVIVLVWLFGIPDPSPPSLQDDPQPRIPGEILYFSTDGCIVAIDASGLNRRELTCPIDAFGVSWLEDGTVLYATYQREADWWVFDPESGETVRIFTGRQPWEVFGPPDNVSPLGERAAFDADGSLVVLDPEPRVVYEYDGPSSYVPGFVTWSPDGEWLMVYYSRDEELWIVARDGSLAGTIAGDVAFGSNVASWRIDGVGVLPTVNPPR